MSKRIPNPVSLPGRKKDTRDPNDFRPRSPEQAPKGESAPAPADSEQMVTEKRHPAAETAAESAAAAESTGSAPTKPAPRRPATKASKPKRTPGNVLD